MYGLKRSDGLTFLPIPYSDEIGVDFTPVQLTHDDHPEMIQLGEKIDTIADGAVLILYNWPKNTDCNRRVQSFVNAFFSRIAEFHQAPHHPKWNEVDFASPLAGWTRLESAEAWLNNNRPGNNANRETADGRTSLEERAQFKAFMSSRKGSAATTSPDAAATNTDSLFDEFVRWRRQQQAL